MVSKREEDSLAPHPLEPGSEFDFADRKGVTEMECAVHIGIGKGAEPFRVTSFDLFHGLIGGEEVGVGSHVIWERRGVNFKSLGCLPCRLSLVLDIDEKVSLVGLGKVSVARISSVLSP